MVEDWTIAVALEAASALVAGAGALRLGRAWALVRDPRLGRLTAFYGSAGLAFLVHALSVVHFELTADQVVERGYDLQFALFWVHHLLLLGALAAAWAAFIPRRATAAAAAPVLLAAEPVLRLVEAALVAGLLVQTLRNHLRRESLGSLTVAAGFFLLLLGQAFFLFNQSLGPDPLGPRSLVGEALVLAGFLVLAVETPGRGKVPG